MSKLLRHELRTLSHIGNCQTLSVYGRMCTILHDASMCIDNDSDDDDMVMSFRCAKYIDHNLKEASLCLSLGNKRFTHFVLNCDVPFLQ